MSADPTTSPPKVGPRWAKRWLDRQPDLSKVKRKPLAAARKMRMIQVFLMGYFRKYKEVIDKYGIQPADQWNFDETGYRLGIGRDHWKVSADFTTRIYSKCPDNWESLGAMECINGIGDDLPPMLILSGIQQLAL